MRFRSAQVDRALVQLPTPPQSTDSGGQRPTDPTCVRGKRTILNEVYMGTHLNHVNIGA